MTFSELIIASVVVLFFIFVSTFLGFKAGMIAVASGDYVCELVEQFDKTTKWECNKAEGMK